MELIDFVSVAAQLLTYASFLSGAKVCHAIHKRKSSAELSPAPFLAGLNCSVLWLRYGFIANEWEIISVNFVGLMFSIFYIGFFVIYAKERSRIYKQVLGLSLFLICLVWSIDHSVDPKFLAGSLASFSSLIACASPLATIQDVLRTKCVVSLPFPIILSSFVVSTSWLIFGYLKEDSFILFSNMVAVSISGAQLALFLIYPSARPYEKLSPSNKKSYDLIKLLNSDEDDEFQMDDMNDDEIDTNRNYRETLSKILDHIYANKEKLVNKQTKATSSVVLLYAN